MCQLINLLIHERIHSIANKDINIIIRFVSFKLSYLRKRVCSFVKK